MSEQATPMGVSPTDQSVTFVELFFDLVFVFSVTQVTKLLHHHLDLVGVGQSVLVFWLVWWAWTQFTWALNAADTTHPVIELGTLLATAVVFVMAVTLPGAFGEGAIWFGTAYVVVRCVGLALYRWVAAKVGAAQHAAVRRFTAMSIGGLLAVLAGAIVGGPAQYWLWGAALFLDLVAAWDSGASAESWNLNPEHFAERHGLFMIIALGESIIVVGAGLVDTELTTDTLALGLLAVGLACALWWTYFAFAKPALDRVLEDGEIQAQSRLARDAYTLLHFPMALGVIALAAALEEAALHPTDPLDTANRLALAIGLVLFVGGMSVAWWRATRDVIWVRPILLAITATTVVLLTGVPPMATLAVAGVGIALLAVLEHRTCAANASG
ncbi:MAG: low temperature requirement protein A [Gemmatimonadetes bacterium]|nr:low temperature requirement protein A [Gemmatimonadota bacterium]